MALARRVNLGDTVREEFFEREEIVERGGFFGREEIIEREEIVERGGLFGGRREEIVREEFIERDRW